MHTCGGYIKNRSVRSVCTYETSGEGMKGFSRILIFGLNSLKFWLNSGVNNRLLHAGLYTFLCTSRGYLELISLNIYHSENHFQR
jgi:hypothetical protein